jgi:hypothetical protein
MLDWETIVAYVREVDKASRVPPETRAAPSAPSFTAEQVRLFRARATHLDERLPAGSLARAAFGGLQDSAPRDALVSMHARVEGVLPDSWADARLVQIWFRWADYVVPRDDVDVFTLGAMPRDARAMDALLSLGDAIDRALGGTERSAGEVPAAIPGIPRDIYIRSAQVTGRFFIRWDARTVALLPAPHPTADPERARLELARRHLHWLGPSTARRFAKWAGTTRADAEQTWDALGGELTDVSIDGSARSILADDMDSLTDVRAIEGVRFLPLGDPHRYGDKVVAEHEPVVDPPGIDARLRNSLAMGRVMLDGSFVASFGRRQNQLTIAPWGDLSEDEGRIQEEAHLLSAPIGKPMRVRWL